MAYPNHNTRAPEGNNQAYHWLLPSRKALMVICVSFSVHEGCVFLTFFNT